MTQLIKKEQKKQKKSLKQMIIILINAKQISKSQLESHKVENKKKDKIVKKHDGELDNKCIFVMMFFF